MDLEQAAQAVLELVLCGDLLRSIGEELELLAKEDLASAAATTAYAHSNYLFGVAAIDGTLYSLVALLYLSRSFAAASIVEACARSSSITTQELLCFLKFGKALQAGDLEDGDGDAEASELLEMLWSRHCLRNGFQVASQVIFKRVFGPEEGEEGDLRDRPLPPVRAFTSQLVDSIQAQVGGKNDDNLIPWLGESREEPDRMFQFRSIPRLFDLIAMVTGSDYFVSLPSRTEGAATCKVISFINNELLMNPELQMLLQPLRERAISTYMNVCHNGRPWEIGDLDRYLVPLTIGKAAKVLRAVECNDLFRHLVTGRPYKAWLLSHEMVVTDAAERARLFLARMDLPVFYHLPLTYAQLCSREARGSLESEAYSAFSLLLPSPFDKQLRQLTMKYMWYKGGEAILHMRPQDYAAAGVPQDSRAWRVLQKFAFPVVVESSQTLRQACRSSLLEVAALLSKMIEAYAGHEREDKQQWLFSGGKPDAEELSLPCLMKPFPRPIRD